jgi:hypothetical protein
MQLRAQAVQLTHLLVNLADPVLKGLDHLPDAQAPGAKSRQLFRNGRQGKARLARHGDEDDLAPLRRLVGAVTARAAPGLQKTQSLVVPQGVDGDAAPRGEFGDLHGSQPSKLRPARSLGACHAGDRALRGAPARVGAAQTFMIATEREFR